MAEYPLVTLESVASTRKGAFAMGPFGSDIKTDNFVESGVPIIKGQNFGRNRLVEDKFDFLTERKADELSNSVAVAGDIVFTHRGTLGQVAMIPRLSRHPRYVVSQSQMKVSLDEAQAIPEFVTYFFQSAAGQHELLSHASQTGVPAIGQPLTSLRKMLVRLPPLAEQRAIAGVLGALDDKIESNRRIQSLLEQETQILFKRFYDAGAGPSTCSEVNLETLVEINPSRRLVRGTTAKYVEMSSLPTKGALVEYWETREVGSGQKFQNGDTLVARITPCLENGKGAYIDFLKDEEVAWGSTEYIVLRPREPLPLPWAYLLSRSERFRHYAIRHMNGSSGRQRCDANALREFKVMVASSEDDRGFSECAVLNFERMRLARNENLELAKLRDALLPELLSGRLRVKDAESLLEDA